jgi:antitoxin (DNA-binding transcriptional repressor) of toxin-antitoxin stability system
VTTFAAEQVVTNNRDIKELKRDASATVDPVEAGETVVITRRGATVARMGPVAAPARAQRLVDEGLMSWPGGPTSGPADVSGA